MRCILSTSLSIALLGAPSLEIRNLSLSQESEQSPEAQLLTEKIFINLRELFQKKMFNAKFELKGNEIKISTETKLYDTPPSYRRSAGQVEGPLDGGIILILSVGIPGPVGNQVSRPQVIDRVFGFLFIDELKLPKKPYVAWYDLKYTRESDRTLIKEIERTIIDSTKDF